MSPQKYQYDLLWEVVKSFGNTVGNRSHTAFPGLIPVSELTFPLEVIRESLAILILLEKDKETVDLLCANYWMNLPRIVPDDVYEKMLNICGQLRINIFDLEMRNRQQSVEQIRNIPQEDWDYLLKVIKSNIDARTKDAFHELRVLKNIAGIPDYEGD